MPTQNEVDCREVALEILAPVAHLSLTDVDYQKYVDAVELRLQRFADSIRGVQPPQNVMATGANRFCQLHDRWYFERCPECRWHS